MEEIEALSKVNNELRATIHIQQQQYGRSNKHYVGFILLFIVISLIGFILGVNWHRKQAMKRLGGLRV